MSEKVMNEILKKRIEEVPYKKIHPYNMEVNDAYNKGFEDGAEYILSHQGISVKKALPELMERVLVAHRLMNRISICITKRIPHDTADPNNGKWHWSLVNHKEDVCAWMPIPKFETNVSI